MKIASMILMGAIIFTSQPALSDDECGDGVIYCYEKNTGKLLHTIQKAFQCGTNLRQFTRVAKTGVVFDACVKTGDWIGAASGCYTKPECFPTKCIAAAVCSKMPFTNIFPGKGWVKIKPGEDIKLN